jgi:hypothetical protein
MKKKQIILGLMVGALSIYLLSNVIVEKKLSDLRNHLDSKIEAQNVLVKELSTTIGRGGVNDQITAVVATCPSDEANQYDSLLSSLDQGLTKNELQGLNILFKRCGAIPASRRAGMSMLFEREVFFLNEMVSERALLGDYETEVAKLAEWNNLVTKEKEISVLFFKLVEAQNEIINTLAGGSANGISIEEIQAEAQKVRDEMALVTESAHAIRTPLISK